ncbi:MAG: zinc-ribbon domain-containing protein, partial [Candidatus Geothermincolales bacterium]
MRCRRCGEEVPEDSSFCIFCGERLEREGGGAPLSFQAQGGAPPSRGDGPGEGEKGTRGEPPHRGREERRIASVAGEGEEGVPAGVYLPPEADLAEPAAVTGMPAESFQPAGEGEPGAEEAPEAADGSPMVEAPPTPDQVPGQVVVLHRHQEDATRYA